MGFKLTINGELVKEFEGLHEAVQSVAIRSQQGEEGIFNVPNHIDTVDVVVVLRDTLESSYLDLEGIEAAQERRDRIEKGSVDRVKEGRKLQAELDKKDKAAAEAAGATATIAEPSDAEKVAAEKAEKAEAKKAAAADKDDAEKAVLS